MAPPMVVRPLVSGDLPALWRLLDDDPVINVFVRHRVRSTGLQERLLGGRFWGSLCSGELVAGCHSGANVVPVAADPAVLAAPDAPALEAFAERLLGDDRRPASLVGPQSMVLPLWDRLEPRWGPARSPRREQPFLQIDHDPVIEPDPRVRPVLLDELDVLYPASVSMFREEVGIEPDVTGRGTYRARVAQLVAQGWSYALIEDDQVLFKAEIGAAMPDACQIQGVWVRPDLRGQGLAAPALAAVIRQVRRRTAPVVSLYVNEHNTVARRLYDRLGFRRTATFASILL